MDVDLGMDTSQPWVFEIHRLPCQELMRFYFCLRKLSNWASGQDLNGGPSAHLLIGRPPRQWGKHLVLAILENV